MMLRERLEDLSVYYWLVELFSDTSFVTIVDGFPIQDLVIPSVASEPQEINILPGELGNSSGIVSRTWTIDVFAVNATQRDEFAYRILHALEEPIQVYNYNEGFPPVSVSKLACLIPEQITMQVVRIMPELVSTLYYRSVIYFTAYRNEL